MFSIFIALIVAIVPALLVFLIVYKMDTIEKESPKLLFKLFLGGAVAYGGAFLLGGLGRAFLQSVYTGKNVILFHLLDSFVLCALFEQVLLLCIIALLTWKDDEFNYIFDGVVYAVTASVGLSITENLIYIFRNASTHKLSELLLTLAGHTICAIYMGYFYSMSKNDKGAGEKKLSKSHMFEAAFIPVVIYGIYIFTLNIQIIFFYVVFIIYAIICGSITVHKIIWLSKNDTILTGLEDVVLSEAEAELAKNAKRW